MTVPNPKSAKKREFAYRPRKVPEFEMLIIRALHGHPEPLCKYFREGGLPRTHEDGNWLAFLLEKKLPPRHRGRPRGSLSSKNFAVQCASYLVRIGKRRWCKHHGTRIATKNTPVDRLIKRAIELVEPQFPSILGKINEDEVRAFNLRPSDQVIEFVADYFPEVRPEMESEALK
jgi:hypothetical protein